MKKILDDLEELKKSYDEIEAVFDSIPAEMRDYKIGPGTWSVNEIIAHLADADLYLTVRTKKCVAEPGTKVDVFEQDLWVNGLYGQEQDPYEALEIMSVLRKSIYNLLVKIPKNKWKNVIKHPENGDMRLDVFPAYFVEHGRIHIMQMKRVHAAWKEAQKK